MWVYQSQQTQTETKHQELFVMIVNLYHVYITVIMMIY